MTELKRPTRFINDPEHYAGRAVVFEYYAPDEVDALLSERDRREGELRAELEKAKHERACACCCGDGIDIAFSPETKERFEQKCPECGGTGLMTAWSDHETRVMAAELAALRQQVREVSEALGPVDDRSLAEHVRELRKRMQENERFRDEANEYGPASSYAEVCAERDALRQQLREVTEWRPMETAPTDLDRHTPIAIRTAWNSTIGVDACRVGHRYWDQMTGRVVLIEDCLGWLPLPPLPKEVERG
jgi:hypothetical protein